MANNKQGQAPFYVVKGIATPVQGFSNGITGDPPAPNLRGEPKAVGTGQLPSGADNKAQGSALSGFFGGKK
jgi:hypothetical protein